MGSSRVPISTIASAESMFIASRIMPPRLISSPIACSLSLRVIISSSVTRSISSRSSPLAFGAVRAAVIICLAASITCVRRISLSLCIIAVCFYIVFAKIKIKM